MAIEPVKYLENFRYRSGLGLPETCYEDPLDTSKQSGFEVELAQANIKLPAEYKIFLSESDGFHAPGICFHGSKPYPGAAEEILPFSTGNNLIKFSAALSDHFQEDMDNRVGLGETNGFVFLFNHAGKAGEQYERHSYRIGLPLLFQKAESFPGVDSSLTLVRKYPILSAMLLDARGLNGALPKATRSSALQLYAVN